MSIKNELYKIYLQEKETRKRFEREYEERDKLQREKFLNSFILPNGEKLNFIQSSLNKNSYLLDIEGRSVVFSLSPCASGYCFHCNQKYIFSMSGLVDFLYRNKFLE